MESALERIWIGANCFFDRGNLIRGLNVLTRLRGTYICLDRLWSSFCKKKNGLRNWDGCNVAVLSWEGRRDRKGSICFRQSRSITNYADIFVPSIRPIFYPREIWFARSSRHDEIRRKVFGTESFFGCNVCARNVTSGENDRGRYPREGKGLMCVRARSPISSWTVINHATPPAFRRFPSTMVN